MTFCSSIFFKLIFERTNELTYENQAIHIRGSNKHDNRATQNRFSRTREEAKLLRENDKSGNGIGSRVETIHEDGMVLNASERRRRKNAEPSVRLSRVGESNSNQTHLNLAIIYDDTTDYEYYEFNYLYKHTM